MGVGRANQEGMEAGRGDHGLADTSYFACRAPEAGGLARSEIRRWEAGMMVLHNWEGGGRCRARGTVCRPLPTAA